MHNSIDRQTDKMFLRKGQIFHASFPMETHVPFWTMISEKCRLINNVVLPCYCDLTHLLIRNCFLYLFEAFIKMPSVQPGGDQF